MLPLRPRTFCWKIHGDASAAVMSPRREGTPCLDSGGRKTNDARPSPRSLAFRSVRGLAEAVGLARRRAQEVSHLLRPGWPRRRRCAFEGPVEIRKQQPAMRGHGTMKLSVFWIFDHASGEDGHNRRHETRELGHFAGKIVRRFRPRKRTIKNERSSRSFFVADLVAKEIPCPPLIQPPVLVPISMIILIPYTFRVIR